MNGPNSQSADAINRLHAQVQAATDSSRQSLGLALRSAWEAGSLLRQEKARVRRTMGAGAWLLWLKQHFRGSVRTAQNYMRLSETEPDSFALAGLSLRQAYLRLGIATEPKCRAQSPELPALPSHIRLAHRLLGTLKVGESAQQSPEVLALYRRDLRSLYDRLRLIFEPVEGNTGTQSASHLP